MWRKAPRASAVPGGRTGRGGAAQLKAGGKGHPRSPEVEAGLRGLGKAGCGEYARVGSGRGSPCWLGGHRVAGAQRGPAQPAAACPPRPWLPGLPILPPSACGELKVCFPLRPYNWTASGSIWET